MSRLFYHTCQDNAGNLLFGVSGTMRLAGTGTLATIYGDEAMTVPIANPMTNHPSFGSFKCFLGVGDYDFYMAKSGYTFETLTGVQGHGTMADQNANAIAVTGGTLTGVQVPNTAGNNIVGLSSVLAAAGGTGRHFLLHQSDAISYLGGPLTVMPYISVNEALNPGAALAITHPKDTRFGIRLHAANTDGGSFHPIIFTNVADATIGSITTTGAATAYNTSSDGRLKACIEPLTGALAVVQALNPVSFLWKADGAAGRGFVAQEVAAVVEGVVSGEADAVDEAGHIVPQQMDASKLVPWLVAAVKELTEQVEMLQAQLAAAGA